MESRSQFLSYDGVQLSYLNCWSLSITRWIQSHWREDNQEPYPQEVYDHFRPDEKAEYALLHFAPDFGSAVRQIQTHLQAAETAWAQFLPGLGKPSARTWQRVLMESQELQERIEKAIETISKGKPPKSNSIDSVIPEDMFRTIAGDLVLRDEVTEEDRPSSEWASICGFGDDTFRNRMSPKKPGPTWRVVESGSQRYRVHVEDLPVNLRGSKKQRDEYLNTLKE